MILELLLLVFVLWLFSYSVSSPQSSHLSHINSQLKKIVPSVPWTLHPSTHHTFVRNKSDIYLVTTRSDGSLYNDNTILHAGIHEVAHILCPTQGHDENFHRIETELLTRGERLGIINRRSPRDRDYPCQD